MDQLLILILPPNLKGTANRSLRYFLIISCVASVLTCFASFQKNGNCTDFGTSDFSYVVTTKTFVDKTGLIRAVIDSTRFVVVSAPKGYGKSTNLDMLKKFFEIHYPDYTKLPPNSNIFKESKVKLEICKDSSFIDQHFPKYPVLFIDFGRFSAVSSYEDMIEAFKKILNKTFLQHTYLLNHSNLFFSKESEKLFIKYCDHSQYFKLTEREIADGFNFLSSLLFRHFNKKVFLLIDDLDAPVLALMSNEPSREVVGGRKTEKEAISFLQNVITDLLKNSGYVSRAFLTANSSAAAHLLCSELSNVISFPFLSNGPFSEFFGLTEGEVQQLLNDFHIKSQLPKIKQSIGGFSVLPNRDIYNTRSVLYYINYKKFVGQWTKTEALPRAFEVFGIAVKIDDLLKGKSVLIKPQKTLKPDHLTALKDLIRAEEPPELTNVDLFLHYLYESGFLALAPNDFYEDNSLMLKIPNEDAKHFFKTHSPPIQSYLGIYDFDYVNVRNFQWELERLSAKSDNSDFFDFGRSIMRLFFEGSLQPGWELEYFKVLYLCAKKKFENTVGNASIGDRKRLDIVVNKGDKVAVVFNIRHKDTAKNALRGIFEEELFKEFDFLMTKAGMVDRIYVGFNIDYENNLSMHYLVNSTDYSNTQNVFIQLRKT